MRRQHWLPLALLASLGLSLLPACSSGGAPDPFPTADGGAGGGNGGGATSDGGSSHCTGTPTPCSLIPGTSCSNQPGCTAMSGCSGIATSCFSLFDQTLCTLQEGCLWESASGTCSGVASSCDLLASDVACTSQQGCGWLPFSGCGGVPTFTCARQESAASCSLIPGCVAD